jgi:hypothetical protein
VRISSGIAPDPHDIELTETLLQLTPAERLRALSRFARLNGIAQDVK